MSRRLAMRTLRSTRHDTADCAPRALARHRASI